MLSTGRLTALLLALILCLTTANLPALAQEDQPSPRTGGMEFTDPDAPDRDPDHTGMIVSFADGTLELNAMTMMIRRPRSGEEGAPEGTLEGAPEGMVPSEGAPEGMVPPEGSLPDGETPPEGQEGSRGAREWNGEMPEGEKMSLKLAQGARLRQIAMVNNEIMVLDIFSDALVAEKMVRIWLNADGDIEYLQLMNMGEGMRRQGA